MIELLAITYCLNTYFFFTIITIVNSLRVRDAFSHSDVRVIDDMDTIMYHHLTDVETNTE